MKVLLINVSKDEYNLGIAKAANFWCRQGHTVHTATSVPTLFAKEFDIVWISAIFSWDVPALIHHALVALSFGKQVEVGGPGTFGVQDRIQQATGLRPQSRPDPRFEREPGSYEQIFWSRGCPAKNCTLGFPKDGRPPICSVPEIEGWKFTLYTDVTPAPSIMDNNLSALPRTHQELIIERTLSAGFDEVDAQSGFEPRSFRPWTAELWKQLPLKAWRFAYDELAEREPVLRMMKLLDDAGVSRRARRIYCLAGNEPFEACNQRVTEIVEWDAKPIVQKRMPLDWLGDPNPLPVLFDWTPQLLTDFKRWATRLSAGMPFSEYRRNMRDGDTRTGSFL